MAASRSLILLTGASGFVGRQILRALQVRGRAVRVVVRDAKKVQNAKESAVEVVTSPDLFAENAAWWADVCRDIDTVIHAAWYVEPGQYLQSSKNHECFLGTLRLAEGAERASVRRLVGIGTCFEYDLNFGYLSIATPLKPSTPYAKAKADTFAALSKCLRESGIEFAWCRLFYLFGEGEDARRLVPLLHAKLGVGEPVELSSGTQIRDYLDVRDAGRMIADAALGSIQGPVNICSGKPITVREIAEKIADEYGRRDLLRFGARLDHDPPCVVGVGDVVGGG